MHRILFFLLIIFLCSVDQGQSTNGKRCKTRDCSKKEKERLKRPVCGSNNVTYENHCLFYNAECLAMKNGTKLTMRYKGRCGSPRIKNCADSSKQCPSARNRRHSVCGSNNVTYPSMCHFRIAKCQAKLKRQTLEMKYRGRCGHPKIKRVPVCPAPRQCHNNLRYICGTDGITYRNHCLFLVEKCKAREKKRKLQIKHLGACGSPTTRKPCPTSCPNRSRPVCATNGKTYKNGCHLALEKCSLPKWEKRQLRVKYNGECGAKRRSRACLSIKKCRRRKGGPVCGTNGKTYRSKCHLRVEKCKMKRRLHLKRIPMLKHMGPCVKSV